MQVSEVCTADVTTVPPTVSVADAAIRMADAGVGTLVVVDDLQRPLGILTDRDLVVRVLAKRVSRKRSIDGVMSDPVAWIHADQPLDAALAEMTRLRVRRLAVVDERLRLVGILALDDALRQGLTEGSALRGAHEANL